MLTGKREKWYRGLSSPQPRSNDWRFRIGRPFLSRCIVKAAKRFFGRARSAPHHQEPAERSQPRSSICLPILEQSKQKPIHNCKQRSLLKSAVDRCPLGIHASQVLDCGTHRCERMHVGLLDVKYELRLLPKDVLQNYTLCISRQNGRIVSLDDANRSGIRGDRLAGKSSRYFSFAVVSRGRA